MWKLTAVQVIAVLVLLSSTSVPWCLILSLSFLFWLCYHLTALFAILAPSWPLHIPMSSGVGFSSVLSSFPCSHFTSGFSCHWEWNSESLLRPRSFCRTWPLLPFFLVSVHTPFHLCSQCPSHADRPVLPHTHLTSEPFVLAVHSATPSLLRLVLASLLCLGLYQMSPPQRTFPDHLV